MFEVELGCEGNEVGQSVSENVPCGRWRTGFVELVKAASDKVASQVQFAITRDYERRACSVANVPWPAIQMPVTGKPA